MFADQLLDFFGLRHLWQQLKPYVSADYIEKNDLITKEQIDSLFTEEEQNNGGEG